MTSTCAFCRIASGEERAHVVYADERTIAFLDANPAVEGHVIVAPKAHRAELLTADEPTAAAVFRTLRTVSATMERALTPDGFSAFYSTASLVGTVTHAHVHLLPRDGDDGVHISLPRSLLDPVEGAELAEHIRAHQ